MGCPKCGGSGWVDSSTQEGSVLRCTCRVVEKTAEDINVAMSIPIDFWSFHEDHIEGGWPQDTRHGRRGFNTAEWFDGSTADMAIMTLHGDIGVGKTAIACELMRRTFYRTEAALPESYTYAQAETIIQELWGQDGQYHRREEYLKAQMLLIDDLGMWAPGSRRSEAAIETVGQLIIERWHHHRPTLITTNRTLVQLFDELPPMADRIRGGHVVKMEGDSIR